MTEQIREEGREVPKSNSSNTNPDMEAEYIPLPSNGYFYKGVHKNISHLKVRTLNWEDEDILTTKSYYDNGTIFTEILKNCIVDENGFNAKDLVSVDRDVILWWLRIGAFGREYIVKQSCPSCGHKHNITWDLGGFNSPDFNEAHVKELFDNGSLTITLPGSGLQCKIVAPSVGRELELYKRLNIKKEKEKHSKDFNITGKLLSVIVEATDKDGKVYKGADQIQQWLKIANNGSPLSMVDSRYIQSKVREIDLEVDTKQDVICPQCTHSQEGVKMPMGIGFFWPEYNQI